MSTLALILLGTATAVAARWSIHHRNRSRRFHEFFTDLDLAPCSCAYCTARTRAAARG